MRGPQGITSFKLQLCQPDAHIYAGGRVFEGLIKIYQCSLQVSGICSLFCLFPDQHRGCAGQLNGSAYGLFCFTGQSCLAAGDGTQMQQSGIGF